MKQKEDWAALQQYLPENSLDYVLPLILEHKVHLTITQPRRSKLGDYRLPLAPYQNHKITVNGNLNKYEFLITLLHELAHMLTFINFGRRIQPHGVEWQKTYATLLVPAIDHHYFPEDVSKELIKSLRSPAASCQGEQSLMRVLRQYNPKPKNAIPIEEVPTGAKFRTKDGEIFFIEKKLRTRYLCVHETSKRKFSFPALYMVQLLPQE